MNLSAFVSPSLTSVWNAFFDTPLDFEKSGKNPGGGGGSLGTGTLGTGTFGTLGTGTNSLGTLVVVTNACSCLSLCSCLILCSCIILCRCIALDS